MSLNPVRPHIFLEINLLSSSNLKMNVVNYLQKYACARYVSISEKSVQNSVIE